MGCSPDALIREEGGLEIKTAIPGVLCGLILSDNFPPEHKAQVQGTLMIMNREWWDLMVFWPGMVPFKKRVVPDLPYQQIMRSEIDRFNDELAAVVEKVRAYGQ